MAVVSSRSGKDVCSWGQPATSGLVVLRRLLSAALVLIFKMLGFFFPSHLTVGTLNAQLYQNDIRYMFLPTATRED